MQSLRGSKITIGTGLVVPPVPTDPGEVLWDGDMSAYTSAVPVTLSGDSPFTSNLSGWEGGPFSSIQGLGNTNSNTATISVDPNMSRNSRESACLKIVMQPGSQRCSANADTDGRWVPDANGTVERWYGASFYYGPDWGDVATLEQEISQSSWHVPFGFRASAPNGSMNVSGDENDSDAIDGQTLVSTPRTFYLRRNTVKHSENPSFYTDGLGLDKIPMGQVVTGRWMDFVLHFKWSTTSNGAFREVWRDGVHMGSSTSLNAVDEVSHSYRLGCYQNTNITHERTLWLSNLRMGTSYSAVDPASN